MFYVNLPPNKFGTIISKFGAGDPATSRGVGSGRWPMKVVLEHLGPAQTGKPPGSLLTDEASLCFRLGYYPLLYLHLIKVHFVKYNYHSMICLLYKKRKWVLPSPEGKALAHVNMVLG